MRNSFKYPLATFTWDGKEYEALDNVIDSKFFTMGNKVSEFEKKFSDYLGGGYAVMVNSGSSANLLMIASLFYTNNEKLKLRAGDEVIVPAVSWPTTYYPLYQYNLKIKFVDINKDTLNISVDAVKKSITDKTKVIFAVNLLGNPSELDSLRDLANERGITLLEDNCESLGAKLNNQFCGTYGVMGSFSTFFSHHISTMEGGLIYTRDEELYHILLCLRAHGWTRNLPATNFVSGVKSSDPFEESFKFVLPGYNLRPLEFSGALGIEQLLKLDNIILERRKNAAIWVKEMTNNEFFDIQNENGESSWFGFSLILKKNLKMERKDIVQKLVNYGFECRPIVAGNFSKNPVVKYFNYSIEGDLYNSDYIDKNGLFIGNHHYPITEAIKELSSINF